MRLGELAQRSWAEALAAMGTTTLAFFLLVVLVPVVSFLFVTTTKWFSTQPRTSWATHARRARWDISAFLTMGIWGVVYAFFFVRTGYREHEGRYSENRNLHAENRDLRDQLEQAKRRAAFLAERVPTEFDKATQEDKEAMRAGLEHAGTHVVSITFLDTPEARGDSLRNLLQRVFESAHWTVWPHSQNSGLDNHARLAVKIGPGNESELQRAVVNALVSGRQNVTTMEITPEEFNQRGIDIHIVIGPFY